MFTFELHEFTIYLIAIVHRDDVGGTQCRHVQGKEGEQQLEVVVGSRNVNFEIAG